MKKRGIGSKRLKEKSFAEKIGLAMVNDALNFRF